MKSFRVTKTAEQIEEQKKIEEISLSQLEQFFGAVADPTLEVTPIAFPENKVEPISLDGLNEFFQLLSSVKPETPIVIESEETIIALEEVKEAVETTIIDRAVDTISKAAVKEAVFEVPNNAKVENNIKSLQSRVETLQNWISKIAMTGPGSGEVNFRWLDDVNRASINDSWVLEYDATSKKFQFTENIGPIRTVQFNTAGPQTPLVAGQIGWNSTEDCLDIKQGDNSTLQVGYEHYIQIKNTTGNTLTNGTVVQFAGVEDGDNPIPTIAKYAANATVMPLYLIGVMTKDVVTGQTGRATVFGKVRNLNTTGTSVGETWTAGTLLWGHPTIAGEMTSVRPTAPNVATSIAAVLKVGTTDGVILVRPTIFPRLYFGDWYSTQNQSHTVINTPKRITVNNEGFTSGFTNNNGLITAHNAGLYNFQFSLQVISTNSSAQYYWIWYRKNGVDVPNSATKLSISSNSVVLAPSWNFPVSMTIGDTFELMWAADSLNLNLSAQPATAFCPSIPSVILTVNQTNL